MWTQRIDEVVYETWVKCKRRENEQNYFQSRRTQESKKSWSEIHPVPVVVDCDWETEIDQVYPTFLADTGTILFRCGRNKSSKKNSN